MNRVIRKRKKRLIFLPTNQKGKAVNGREGEEGRKKRERDRISRSPKRDKPSGAYLLGCSTYLPPTSKGREKRGEKGPFLVKLRSPKKKKAS